MHQPQETARKPERRAVIFVNGHVADYAGLARWLRADDHLIAADGGLAHCFALGLTPHVVVGDLDSASPEVVAELAAQGVPIERHPPTKDQTDLELAIERALSDGSSEIWLLGALGGRLDQTLANLLILAQRDWPVPIRVAEGDQVAQVLAASRTLDLAGEVGSTVSILPLSPHVTGITFKGLLFPLKNATLAMGSTRGISNEIASMPASITIEAGTLLVVQTLGV